MRAPDFWNDADSGAQRTSAEYSRLKRRLDDFATLEGRCGDLEATEERTARSSPATRSTASCFSELNTRPRRPRA